MLNPQPQQQAPSQAQQPLPQFARNDAASAPQGAPRNGVDAFRQQYAMLTQQPQGPQQQQSQVAQNNAPYPGSNLNRINPKDPSGPLLPEGGQQQQQFAQNEQPVSAKSYFEQRYAPGPSAPQSEQARLESQWANRPQYDYSRSAASSPGPVPAQAANPQQIAQDYEAMRASGIAPRAPEQSQQLFGALSGDKGSTLLGMEMANRVDPSLMQQIPPAGLGATQLADNRSGGAPLMGDSAAAAPAPQMNFGGAPVHVAQVHQAPQGGMNQMLMEPQGGGGGVEGMAGGISSPAQMSPEMMNPQAMAGQSGEFGDLGGLFADMFMPEMPQFADAGGDPFGGGGDMGGGFDLASIFA
jgi:hypothetical protein